MAWTIDQLVEECVRVLANEPQPSGRVNDAPDLRTIRYYAAMGLLDAPQAFAKKKALYDERHLHQLIAIKRLQRQGRTLAEIQRELAGITEARLRVLAGARTAGPEVARPTPVLAPRASDRFWARRPRGPEPVRAVRVAPGITLLLEGTPRAFTDEDARALCGWLSARGLTPKEDPG